MAAAESAPDFRVVLVRGTKQLTVEVRGPTIYTYLDERTEGAAPTTTDAKFFSKPAVALRNAEKLRDARLAAGWEEADGAGPPHSAARTWEQAGRELRAKLLKPSHLTLGGFVDAWDEWSRVRLVGSDESFRAEADWGDSEGALVAPPSGVKCKRVSVRRWYRSLRSGPSGIVAAAFVEDRLVKPFSIADGPRAAVVAKLRAAVADAIDAPVLGLWMFPNERS